MPKDIKQPDITQALPDILGLTGRVSFSMDENLVGDIQLLDVQDSPWVLAYRRFSFDGASPAPVTPGYFNGYNFTPAQNTVLQITGLSYLERTGVQQVMHLNILQEQGRVAGAMNQLSAVSITSIDRPDQESGRVRIATLAQYVEFSAAVPGFSTSVRETTVSAFAQVDVPLSEPLVFWSGSQPLSLAFSTESPQPQVAPRIILEGREWKVRRRASI